MALLTETKLVLRNTVGRLPLSDEFIAPLPPQGGFYEHIS